MLIGPNNPLAAALAITLLVGQNALLIQHKRGMLPFELPEQLPPTPPPPTLRSEVVFEPEPVVTTVQVKPANTKQYYDRLHHEIPVEIPTIWNKRYYTQQYEALEQK